MVCVQASQFINMLVKDLLENKKKNYDLNENEEAMVIGLPMVNSHILSNNLTTDVSALTSPVLSALSNSNASTLTTLDWKEVDGQTYNICDN